MGAQVKDKGAKRVGAKAVATQSGAKKKTAVVALAGGDLDGGLIGDEKLRQLYAGMLKFRLGLTGGCAEPGFFAMGQEAVAAGTAIDLRADDAVGGATGVGIAGRQPVSIAAASATAMQLIGAGLAMGYRLVKSDAVVLVYCTEAGARGVCAEAVGFAGVNEVPMVFVVLDSRNENEQIGGATDVCLTAGASQVPAITVDGNDVVAVYRVAQEATGRARRGQGATIMDCRTYCLEAHGGVEAEKRWQEKDPILRMERYLAAKGLFSLAWKRALLASF